MGKVLDRSNKLLKDVNTVAKKQLFFLSLLVLVIILAGNIIFAADTEYPGIILKGTQLHLKAVVREGELYLPVRSVSESNGFAVRWLHEEQTVTISTGNKVISIDLPENKIISNGHETYMLCKPVLLENRVYLDAAFFTDNLGLKVQWDKGNNLVILSDLNENKLTINTVQISSENAALKTMVQYPVIEGLEYKQIQDELNLLFKKIADAAVQEGKENADLLAPYVSKNPNMPGQCETYLNYQIKYNRNNYLSLIFQNYQYAGGAHGNTVQSGYTFSLENGRKYTLKDLFKSESDYITILSDTVKEQLVKRELTEALFRPFERISEDQGCYLSNNGLVVYFQQYEILPYASGIQEFTADYNLLTDLLKEPEIIK